MARSSLRRATSRSPATTRTARSTRASPATASRRPTSGPRRGDTGWRSRATARSSRSAALERFRRRLRARPLQPERLARHELLRRRQADDRLRGLRRGERGGAPGRRQDRRGRRPPAGAAERLRARPLQPERLARHELLRRRQADDRLRGLPTAASGVALQGDGKIVAVGSARRTPRRRLRARPLQPQRLARPELLRRRQADDRLRRLRRGERGGAPERRQDRRGRADRQRRAPRLRARPLQPERLARHELLRRRQADDRLRGLDDGRHGVALQGERQDRRGRAARGSGGDFALARYNPNGTLDTSFSGDGKQTTDFGGCSDEATGGGAPGGRQDRRRRRGGGPGAQRLRARPLQPERVARHELLRRRQADDRLRRPTRAQRGGDPGRRQDRRGRLAAAATRDFALARYNPNGSLDTSFSGDGKQTTDFGGYRRGERGGAPGRRQDRRGRLGAAPAALAATSRSPATTPTARSTRASPATASRRPTSGASRPGERGGAPGRRQDRRGRQRRPAPPATTSRSPATTPTARSTRASPATASRRPTSGASDEANGVALQGDGKIVAVGVASAT